MKIKISILILIITLCYTKAKCQENLILNPSFEDISGVDTFFNTTNRKLDVTKFPRFWQSPSRINKATLINGDKSEEQGCQLLQKPRSGKHMVSLITFSPAEERWHNPFDAQSYIQGELKEPLKIGKKYDVELWVQARDTALNECFDKIHTYPSVIFVYSNNIGVLFTEKKFYFKRELDTIPQINESKIIITAVNDWYKISGSFIADKPFRILTIGNFFKGFLNETSLSAENRPIRVIEEGSIIRQRGAIYHLDDISVTLSKDQPISFSVGQPIVIDNIFFETGESVLLPNSFTSLDKFCKALKESDFKQIDIFGHTDNTGNESKNLKLSENRALSVLNYFIAHGISKEKLSYQGLGSMQPVVPNTSDKNKQKNRRVEITVR